MATLGVSSVSLATRMAGQAAKLAWRNVRIAQAMLLTPRIKSIVLETPADFAFQPGQHIDVRLTAPDGYQAQRSYSIASAPAPKPTVELLIEKLDDGEVSPFFHEIAAVGDEIEIRGPIGGYFIWPDGEHSAAAKDPVLLVAGGSGVAPLISMVRQRAAANLEAPMALLLSARKEADVAYRDELIGLHDRRDGFELALAITRGRPLRSLDFARRVDVEMVAELLGRLPSKPADVYVCGSNPFAEAAAQVLIATGISPSVIRTERYGG